jgi:hypothetical protein
VAQDENPEFKPQHHKKKKKRLSGPGIIDIFLGKFSSTLTGYLSIKGKRHS